MKGGAILTGLLPAATSAGGEEGWQPEAEGKVRTEYEKARGAGLPDSWKVDLTKWKMADDPSLQMVKRARQLLDAKGVGRTDRHGETAGNLRLSRWIRGGRMVADYCTFTRAPLVGTMK